MNLIIPFTKDIKFKTNIGEILSVSLEHEHTANSSEILGNFIVSGEYKTHEVSVNKEKFEHVLPFSVDLSTRIDTDSVFFNVEDFTYEVIDGDTLRVNIEYSVNADEVKEVEKEEISDDYFDELIEEIEERHEEKPMVEEEIKEEEEVVDVVEEERKIEEENQNAILESISDKEDEYITYHIHIYKETDTLEQIYMKYNTSENTLSKYNDLKNISPGMKLIIPEVDE